MSVSSVSSPSVSVNEAFTSRAAERAAAVDGGVAVTLAGVASSISDGVSATVSFSGKALSALEQAGESAVDAVVDGAHTIASATGTVVHEAEDIAVGAWHALEHGAQAVEQAGEAVGSAIATGAEDVATAAWSAGKELAHYAAVGVSATGSALSEVASGTVMAAAAGGRSLIAML